MEQKIKDILLYGMSADILQVFVHHDISSDEISSFLEENKDRKDSLTHVFRLACIEGRIDVADKLFHITSAGLRNDAFYLSATAGQLPSLAYLVGKGVDPKHENSRSLCSVAANGFSDCVEYLISLSDVSAHYWKPIKEAVTNNHLECVKLLATGWIRTSASSDSSVFDDVCLVAAN